MKIFSAEQIRQWDEYTIQHEPISSVNLMERAAVRSTEWIISGFPGQKTFLVFCGPGNNGGDGLAIARLLRLSEKEVFVFITDTGSTNSPDFKINKTRLSESDIPVTIIKDEADFPQIPENSIIIDALFGTGLNKPLTGLAAASVSRINDTGNLVIAIDMPSGLFADRPSPDGQIVCADYTLSFQTPKLAFMIPENERYSGEVVILDIGLSPDFSANTESPFYLNKPELLCHFLKKRPRFSHKGTFGHAALIAGSYGMLGAAILSARACLRSGVGKLTCFTNAKSYPVLQAGLAESIFFVAEEQEWKSQFARPSQYQAAGVGPGLGKNDNLTSLLSVLFEAGIPLVLDADALNHMAAFRELLKHMPHGTIICPHIKELERLFGKTSNGFERIDLAKEKAAQYGIYIIVKGYRSQIVCPDGRVFFNETGNPGMATAGTGDVLTGMLTGFLARGYSPEAACRLAVYLHGLAGDIAVKTIPAEALIAGDLIGFLPSAIAEFENFCRINSKVFLKFASL